MYSPICLLTSRQPLPTIFVMRPHCGDCFSFQQVFRRTYWPVPPRGSSGHSAIMQTEEYLFHQTCNSLTDDGCGVQDDMSKNI